MTFRGGSEANQEFFKQPNLLEFRRMRAAIQSCFKIYRALKKSDNCLPWRSMFVKLFSFKGQFQVFFLQLRRLSVCNGWIWKLAETSKKSIYWTSMKVKAVHWTVVQNRLQDVPTLYQIFMYSYFENYFLINKLFKRPNGKQTVACGCCWRSRFKTQLSLLAWPDNWNNRLSRQIVGKMNYTFTFLTDCL